MTEEEMILVGWYDCDCGWSTKYCDEFHRRLVRIPLSKIKQWIEEENQ